MRTWHFYDEITGAFIGDSIGAQNFDGIESWVAANAPRGCKAYESTGGSVRRKRIDVASGKLVDADQPTG